MKSLIFVIISVLSFNAYGDFSDALVAKPKKKTFTQKLGLNFELVTELDQNYEREIIGTKNFFEANLTYRFDKKNRLVMANGGSALFREGEEDKFNYDYVQFEYSRTKILTEYENGFDLWAQGRVSYTTNDQLRNRYGSYGLAEGRLYFGKKLSKSFSINRYISYLRFQKYFIKGNSPYSRSVGWKAMISPSYQIKRGFDASLLMSYSGYQLANYNLDEMVEFSPSVRYQFSRMALIVSAEFKPYDTIDGSFKYVEGFETKPTWATILSFYAF